DLGAVPDLGGFAEVLVEDAEGAGAADVVRHEHVDVDPDVFAGGDRVAVGGAGEDPFGQGLRRHEVAPCGGAVGATSSISGPGEGRQGAARPRGSANSWARGTAKPGNTGSPVRVSA